MQKAPSRSTLLGIGAAVVIVGGALYLLRKGRKSRPVTSPNLSTPADLFPLFTDQWNKMLRAIKDAPIPTGGTMDKIPLNITAGFSTPWPSIVGKLLPLPSVDVTVSIANLQGFASHMTFKATRIDLSPPSAGAQRKITVDFTGVADRLQSWIGFSFAANSSLISVTGKCPDDTTVTFYGVRVKASVEYTLEGDCALGFGKIVDVQVKNMSGVSIDTMDFPCSVRLDVSTYLPLPPIPTFSVGDMGISGTMSNIFSTKILPTFLQSFLPPFLSAAKGQVAPCLLLPPPNQACIPGIQVAGHSPFRTTGLTGITANGCEAICQGLPNCVAAWMQPHGGGPLGPPGSCILYEKYGAPFIPMTGFLWDKKTGTVTQQMPETGQAATKELVMQAKDVEAFTAKDCANICYSLRDADPVNSFPCTNFMYDGKCHMFQNDGTVVRTGVQLATGTTCERNVKDPYVIYAV